MGAGSGDYSVFANLPCFSSLEPKRGEGKSGNNNSTAEGMNSEFEVEGFRNVPKFVEFEVNNPVEFPKFN